MSVYEHSSYAPNSSDSHYTSGEKSPADWGYTSKSSTLGYKKEEEKRPSKRGAFSPKNRGYCGESNEAHGEEEEKRRSNRDSEEHTAILRDTMHTEPRKLQFSAHLIDMFIQVLLNTPSQLAH